MLFSFACIYSFGLRDSPGASMGVFDLSDVRGTSIQSDWAVLLACLIPHAALEVCGYAHAIPRRKKIHTRAIELQLHRECANLRLNIDAPPDQLQ